MVRLIGVDLPRNKRIAYDCREEHRRLLSAVYSLLCSFIKRRFVPFLCVWAHRILRRLTRRPSRLSASTRLPPYLPTHLVPSFISIMVIMDYRLQKSALIGVYRRRVEEPTIGERT